MVDWNNAEIAAAVWHIQFTSIHINSPVAQSDPGALQEIRMAGFTKCLTKPFERQAFYSNCWQSQRSLILELWNLKTVLYNQKHLTGCHAGILHILWWTSFATTTAGIRLECGWTLSRTQSMNGRYTDDMHASVQVHRWCQTTTNRGEYDFHYKWVAMSKCLVGFSIIYKLVAMSSILCGIAA